MPEFLVVYDYGGDGLWALMEAPSDEQLLSRYPELDIVPERPAWLTDERFADLERHTLDETPWGMLEAVPAPTVRRRLPDEPASDVAQIRAPVLMLDSYVLQPPLRGRLAYPLAHASIGNRDDLLWARLSPPVVLEASMRLETVLLLPRQKGGTLRPLPVRPVQVDVCTASGAAADPATLPRTVDPADLKAETWGLLRPYAEPRP
jgi:hypothetical protein